VASSSTRARRYAPTPAACTPLETLAALSCRVPDRRSPPPSPRGPVPPPPRRPKDAPWREGALRYASRCPLAAPLATAFESDALNRPRNRVDPGMRGCDRDEEFG